MVKCVPWTERENEECEKFFKTDVTLPTLYYRLQKINPDRSYAAVRRKIYEMRLQRNLKKPKVAAQEKLKVGYLDIEASNLNGNFGYMLSWYIKTENKNEYKWALITKKELNNYTFDKRITLELLKAIKEYDILYTHYGSDWRFDFPFIRTRAYAWGLEDHLPGQHEVFIRDTYPIAKAKLKLSSNRLDMIAACLGIKVKKTPVAPKKWVLACAGHPEALKYVLIHNKRDVQVLQAVHQKLKKVERPRFSSI